MKLERDQVIDWLRKFYGEVVSGICGAIIIVMVFLAIRLRDTTAIVIGTLGVLSILSIFLERRTKPFDKIVSVLVIFALAFGFMVFN